MEPNHFEFAVTRHIDWRDRETIYVKALTSHEAIDYMRSITDDEDDNKEFADFIYRCYVPESALLNGVSVYNAMQKPLPVVEFSQENNPGIPFMDWWVARCDGQLIATIGRNHNCESHYSMTAYSMFGAPWCRTVIDYNFTGGGMTLEEAKDKASEFARHLNGV